ncbi:MAG: DarT ssDNA thymidine ADP-ribosyltransferase family protein [Lachnospiraceae bacterium]|nr:DarT ssDNA thymidine ADP-ribosyltransferase family protein [Lachnospiraceae bacterium]
MGLESVQTGKLLYHLTKLSNMESIINDGLLPRKYLFEKEAIFEDVADPKIITKRTELGLDCYTPFHFHPYSSFDVAVKNTYSNEKFVYICISRSLAQFNNFGVLVKHPLSQDECVIYDYDEGIKLIDWETMKMVGVESDYAKNVKMAECITNKRIPAELFQCIYAPDEETKQIVESLLTKKNITEHPPYVNVQGCWFC